MTETPYVVDKTGWGPGAWNEEPDRVDFVHAGLPCLALRHPNHGHWCGYAAVPPGHPLHGRDWTKYDLPLLFHHEINYSAECDGGMVCHVPAPGEPDGVWWFGGDFGHIFDFAPGQEARLREACASADARRAPWTETIRAAMTPRGENDALFQEVYRALPYVRTQIERLAEQLAAIGGAA